MDYCEPYGLVQTVAPAIEPALWTDVASSSKTWSRDPNDDGQTVIDLLITAAREKVEIWTNRQLITATWALTLDKFPSWEIQLPSKAPWIAISSVVYVDGDGASQTMAAADYRFHAATGRLTPAYGDVWPATRSQTGTATITFTAGYGTDAADVPAGIRLAILATVLDWLENRALRFELPPGVKSQLLEFQHGRLWG